MDKQTAVHTLWDYMCLHQTPEKADCIVGFGCYNEDVAVISPGLGTPGPVHRRTGQKHQRHVDRE